MADASTVLVTGASSGIGAACALRLDAAGMRVFAGVRRDPDADALASRSSSRLTPLLLDVTDAESIRSAAATVAGTVGATYSASKAGVAALCDSLRVELAPWGIRVVLVEPGAVATAIWGKGRAALDERQATLPSAATALYGGAVEAMRRVAERVEGMAVSPDRVAAVVERALTTAHPRSRYLVGADARVQAALRRLPAPVRDALLTRAMGLPRGAGGDTRP